MTFHELAALIGQGPALSLIAVLGGVQVYIPKRPAPGNRIVAAIGQEAANILSAEYGGERVDLPKSRMHLRAPILTRVLMGELSQRQAALILDLTERQIGNLVRGRTDPRQQRLFDKS